VAGVTVIPGVLVFVGVNVEVAATRWADKSRFIANSLRKFCFILRVLVLLLLNPNI
jgi:hypothetical protein